MQTEKEQQEAGQYSSKAMQSKPRKSKKVILACILVALLVPLGLFAYNFYKNTYWPAKKWITYQASDGSFNYPSNWKSIFCSTDEKRVIFTLPGKVRTDFIDGKKHQIFLEGASDNLCQDGKVVLAAGTLQNCLKANSYSHIIKLSDGTHLKLSVYEDKVGSVSIHTSQCADAVFTFDFESVQYPDGPADEDRYKYNGPEMSTEDFLKSAQYKDIVKFAESIEIKK